MSLLTGTQTHNHISLVTLCFCFVSPTTTVSHFLLFVFFFFLLLLCSLSMFQLMRPIPEILILGRGRYIELVDPEQRCFIQSTGMKLEVVDSRNAISTYNILNEEGRMVAAALLPYGCRVSS